MEQWVKETSSKPPKAITAKKALEVIETVTKGYENWPRARMTTRANPNAKESSVPGMMKREGWISFQVKGELHEAKSAASCFNVGHPFSFSANSWAH